jgi:spermidine/putrescine transport system substrate-binding protein
MQHQGTENSSNRSGKRRQFLKTTAAGAAAVGLAGCLGGLGGGGGGTPTINVLTWEEYRDLNGMIEERLDVNMSVTSSTSPAKMFSQWNSGADEQYDIVVPEHNYVKKFMDADLVAPMPEDVVTNYEDMYEYFRNFVGDNYARDGQVYTAPSRFGWHAYSYNGDEVAEHDPSYAVLFEDDYVDTDLSGKLVMYDNHFKAMAVTSLYLGYQDAFEGDAVTLSDDQIRTVKERLIEQKSDLYGYIASDQTFIQSYKQGNFLVAESGRNEIIQMQANDGINAVMTVPSEGAFAWIETPLVSKASENQEAAWQVVNQYISSEVGAELARVGFSPSCNPTTRENLSEDENSMFGAVEPSKLEGFIPYKVVEGEDRWLQAWEEVKQA